MTLVSGNNFPVLSGVSSVSRTEQTTKAGEECSDPRQRKLWTPCTVFSYENQDAKHYSRIKYDNRHSFARRKGTLAAQGKGGP